MKKLLLALLLTAVGAFAQGGPGTTYSNIGWDVGATTPSYCTPPSWFYNTGNNILYTCVVHTPTAPTVLAANVPASLDSTTSVNGTNIPASKSLVDTTSVLTNANMPADVGVWTKYTITKIANGVSGCANAKGCWQVNTGTPVAAATATSQAVTFVAATTAGVALEKVRLKTKTACAGLTAITISDIGTTASAAEFFTSGTYDLKAVVAATNILWPTLLTPGATTASTAWKVTIAAGAENVDDITNGCAFDLHAKTSVLP